jgi:Flp pilus assembly protein TadD
VRYTWELETKGHPVQRAQFELLAVADANRIQSALALLDPATLSGYPKNTVTLMRAGLLFQEGIYHGARRELLTAIAADPDEPTLHHLLGQVYDRIGLKELAAQEFDEAQFLSTRSP